MAVIFQLLWLENSSVRVVCLQDEGEEAVELFVFFNGAADEGEEVGLFVVFKYAAEEGEEVELFVVFLEALLGVQTSTLSPP